MYVRFKLTLQKENNIYLFFKSVHVVFKSSVVFWSQKREEANGSVVKLSELCQ